MEKEYLEKLETLVNIDCGSTNQLGIKKVSDIIGQWYKEIDWYVKEIPLENNICPVLEISNKPNCEYYDVMLIGHMDTVFPIGTVEKRKFKLNGDIITGPGCEDMKNGDVTMFMLAKHLTENTLDKLNICMCYNPDEEISSIYSRNVLDNIASKSKKIFVMESAQKDGISHCIGRKGRLHYKIDIEGKAGHAGFIYKIDAASAIEALGYYIQEIYALSDKEKDTTVNIGLVQAGTALNVVADKASLEVEMRFTDILEQERIEKGIDSIVNRSFVEGTKATITYKEAMPSWSQAPQGLEYIEHVKKLTSKHNIKFETHYRGGLSDANHLAQYCPVILDGMGPFGAFAHSEQEYTTLSSFEPTFNLLKTLIEDLV